jgi:hypothetical protein
MNQAIAILIAFFLGAAAFATPISLTGQGPTGMTMQTVSVGATNTSVALTLPAQYVTVVNTSSSTTIYFSTLSPATTSSFPILPNAAYSYGGSPISNIYLISATGTVTAGVMSH